MLDVTRNYLQATEWRYVSHKGTLQIDLNSRPTHKLPPTTTLFTTITLTVHFTHYDLSFIIIHLIVYTPTDPSQKNTPYLKNFRQLGHHIKVKTDTARDEANWAASQEKWAASGKKESDEKKAAAKKVQKSE